MKSKSFLKIWLLSVDFEKFTSMDLWTDQSQSSVGRAVIGPQHKFIEVNFSKLTDCNQIFRIDIASIHYHLGEISCQIIECKIFGPYEP